MKRTIMAACCSVFSANALSFDANLSQWGVYSELSGGLISDTALYASAGRETQIWKMTNAMVGINFKEKEGPWYGKIEIMALNDEVRFEEENAVYNDYYKNIGTDLLYYGDSPLREGFLGYSNDNINIKAGRMINNYGMNYHDLPYVNRHEAPHAVYLNNELLTGLSLSYQFKNWEYSASILNGRGTPTRSYNIYLDGQTNPNTKGNNTPIIQSRLSYENKWGDLSYGGSISYHRNKTGSAPGTLYSGKHNDNRKNLSLNASFNLDSTIDSVELWGQVNRYEEGLTEEGVQKRRTPDASKNLSRDGWFLTTRINLTQRLSVQYTHEQLDRINALLWDEVADFDANHPIMNSKEKNNILSVKYSFSDAISLNTYYSKPDFDHKEVSNIMESKGVDKYGIILESKF